MDQSEQIRLSTFINDFHLPRYTEIPDMGLYLEQTANYITSYLEPLEDINITTSMISNYVKKKLVDHPVKKQYKRDQIARLIFIVIAKSVLSLDNIRLLLDMQRQSCDDRMAYDYFCDQFEHAIQQVFQQKDIFTSNEINASDKYYEEKKLLYHMNTTAAHKIYLDSYFSFLEHQI